MATDMIRRATGAAFAAAAVLAASGCTGQAVATPSASAAAPLATAQVSIETPNGPHAFTVEVAASEEAQRKGLMYRRDIPADGGMLFAPYPPEGGGPREAFFWMKNTPSALDIIFIRADGTIARVAANAVPYSEDTIDSGEPVAAVLEIRGGRAAELGIAAGERVTWPGHGA